MRQSTPQTLAFLLANSGYVLRTTPTSTQVRVHRLHRRLVAVPVTGTLWHNTSSKYCYPCVPLAHQLLGRQQQRGVGAPPAHAALLSAPTSSSLPAKTVGIAAPCFPYIPSSMPHPLRGSPLEPHCSPCSLTHAADDPAPSAPVPDASTPCSFCPCSFCPCA